jgi:hypothetical protein
VNVHALTEDKIDDMKDSFNYELECVFDTFHKYHKKILLCDLSDKVGRKTFSNQQLGMRVHIKLVMIISYSGKLCHL